MASGAARPSSSSTLSDLLSIRSQPVRSMLLQVLTAIWVSQVFMLLSPPEGRHVPPCFDEGLLEGILCQCSFAHVDQAQAENIVPVLLDELLDLHLITSLPLPETIRAADSFHLYRRRMFQFASVLMEFFFPAVDKSG